MGSRIQPQPKPCVVGVSPGLVEQVRPRLCGAGAHPGLVEHDQMQALWSKTKCRPCEAGQSSVLVEQDQVQALCVRIGFVMNLSSPHVLLHGRKGP